MLLFDDNKMKMARKPVKKQEEIQAGCAVEGKQSKRKIAEEKRSVGGAEYEGVVGHDALRKANRVKGK